MGKLLFGCGYLGERVAQRWRDAGETVVLVTRSAERAEAFKRQGYRAIVADVTRPETLSDLPTSETVLFAVGFDHSEGQSIEAVYAGGVRNVLHALRPDTGRFIYISTTGVYGDALGGWIDEQTPPDPQRDGGRASLAAEQEIAAHWVGKHSVILRMAGLYGSGRIPFLDKLLAGEPIPAAIAGYLNLIHVDDAASVVLSADRLSRNAERFMLPVPLGEGWGEGDSRSGPSVYCVSDGHPVERGEFYREVARRIGAPPPTFVEPEPNSPRANRALANRRVCNERMRRELSGQLAFPDYRVGLAAVLG